MKTDCILQARQRSGEWVTYDQFAGITPATEAAKEATKDRSDPIQWRLLDAETLIVAAYFDTKMGKVSPSSLK